MFFVVFDIDLSDEDDFNVWYDCEYIEECVWMDGVIFVVCYVFVESWLKYLSLYWVELLFIFVLKVYIYVF